MSPCLSVPVVMPDITRALVIGAGSAGRRHLRNLRQLLPRAVLVCWRITQTPADAELASLADSVVFTADEALTPRPALAVVAGPAPTHACTAEACLAADVPTLIEKPLAASLADADRLVAAAGAARVPVLMGFTLRFYPPLIALATLLARGELGRVAGLRAEVGQDLRDWRPGSDWRRGVSAQASLGGGVLLELSHEIDYARWLMGEVTAIGAVVATGILGLDVDEYVDVVCRFATGAVGSLHMDCLQRPLTRSCRVVGEHGMVDLDLVGHRMRRSTERGDWRDVATWPTFERNHMFLDELRHLVACLVGVDTPRVTVDDGRRVLALALSARAAAETARFMHV